MKTETEIKLIIPESLVRAVIDKVEREFSCKKNEPFHQITHQFFLEDYTKQNVFPRIRNERDGSNSLTLKIKPREESDFFRRTELETSIDNVEDVVDMMPFLGFPQKISWEKRRHSFSGSNNGIDVQFFLDETPMGWFLEIEATEEVINESITRLGLDKARKANKAYLGLWEKYKKKCGISHKDMLFNP